MKVTVKKGDVTYVCTSDEQLQLFVEAGYEEKQPEAKHEETPKAARKTRK